MNEFVYVDIYNNNIIYILACTRRFTAAVGSSSKRDMRVSCVYIVSISISICVFVYIFFYSNTKAQNNDTR